MVLSGHYDGLQWLQIDLEQEASMDVIWIWHRSGMDTCVYHDVIVEVSNDPDFKRGVVQVFNDDYDNSAGRGRGTDRPYTESNYGKPIQAKGATGRYVRCWSRGSNFSEDSHYTEIEVYGRNTTESVAGAASNPIDPMSPGFKAFEKEFWDWAAEQRLAADLSADLRLVGTDQIVILVSREIYPSEREKLDGLMRQADELWHAHLPGRPLKAIEIQSADGKLVDHWQPKDGAKQR